MKRHRFAHRITIEYKFVNKEIVKRQIYLKLYKDLSTYLDIVENADWELPHRLGNIVNPELISAVRWELLGIERDIENINQRIKFQLEQVKKFSVSLG